MRRLRCILPTEIYFVTTRTVNEQFTLTPYACPGAFGIVTPDTPLDRETRRALVRQGQACVRETEALTQRIAEVERGLSPMPAVEATSFKNSIPNIVGGWLSRAVHLFKIKLYGFVWMSNHVHLLIQAPLGNLAEFMAYLNGQIARDVNRFLGRRHQFWARRYSLEPVLDEPAELQRLVYILTNPQKAQIAGSIEQWPGLSSAGFLLERKAQRFLCFDRTRWCRDGRPDRIERYLSTIELSHDELPQFSISGAPRAANDTLRRSILEREAAIRLANVKTDEHTDRKCAEEFQTKPIRRAMQDVVATDRSTRPKRSPEPLCHTTKRSLHDAFKRGFKAFVSVYRRSAQAYAQGEVDVFFPPGAFAPSRFPLARHPTAADASSLPHLTRKNVAIAAAWNESWSHAA